MKITDEEAAGEVSAALQEVFDRLGRSIVFVNERCDPNEAKVYRERVGDLFYNLVFKMLEPLYVDHPKLRPEGWDDKPPLDPD